MIVGFHERLAQELWNLVTRRINHEDSKYLNQLAVRATLDYEPLTIQIWGGYKIHIRTKRNIFNNPHWYVMARIPEGRIPLGMATTVSIYHSSANVHIDIPEFIIPTWSIFYKNIVTLYWSKMSPLPGVFPCAVKCCPIITKICLQLYTNKYPYWSAYIVIEGYKRS